MVSDYPFAGQATVVVSDTRRLASNRCKDCEITYVTVAGDAFSDECPMCGLDDALVAVTPSPELVQDTISAWGGS